MGLRLFIFTVSTNTKLKTFELFLLSFDKRVNQIAIVEKRTRKDTQLTDIEM